MKKVVMMMLCMGQIAMVSAEGAVRISNLGRVAEGELVVRRPTVDDGFFTRIGRKLNDWVARLGKGNTNTTQTPGRLAPMPVDASLLVSATVAVVPDAAQEAPEKDDAAIRADGNHAVNFADRFHSALGLRPKQTFDEMTTEIDKITSQISDLTTLRNKKIEDIVKQFKNLDDDIPTGQNMNKAITSETSVITKEINRLLKVRSALDKKRAKEFPVEAKAISDAAEVAEKADQATVIEKIRESKKSFLIKRYYGEREK